MTNHGQRKIFVTHFPWTYHVTNAARSSWPPSSFIHSWCLLNQLSNWSMASLKDTAVSCHTLHICKMDQMAVGSKEKRQQWIAVSSLFFFKYQDPSVLLLVKAKLHFNYNAISLYSLQLKHTKRAIRVNQQRFIMEPQSKPSKTFT